MRAPSYITQQLFDSDPKIFNLTCPHTRATFCRQVDQIHYRATMDTIVSDAKKLWKLVDEVKILTRHYAKTLRGREDEDPSHLTPEQEAMSNCRNFGE